VSPISSYDPARKYSAEMKPLTERSSTFALRAAAAT
jgi:hypothetical protein